ncbi:unnamed protein product [Didymodactylos carnosus]|uniref:Uncharacterized protein n=2 Tax=Didymodactylos carnosus TaxID=1234261 RepID=A0A815WE51_9BILA|nr:unnamed protein product [Didymodactylos carnosus]CAF4402535.1 unnamed protein product [Didymodactylos carnosus]
MQTNTDEFKAETGEQFPTEVIFNGEDLVHHHARDHQQYGRDLIKKLFSVNELASSILLPNDKYKRPHLDIARMSVFKNAVRRKYKISAQKWDEFFQKCMHRTLTQCLCDIRKKLKAQQQLQQAADEQQATYGQQPQQATTN